MEETGATAARDRAAVQRQTSSQPDAVAEVGAAGSKAAVPAVKAVVPILVWATAAVGAEGRTWFLRADRRPRTIAAHLR
jgi:hypothetical protein